MASFYPELYQTRSGCSSRREAVGLTQAQLAARFGQPEAFVARYEEGDRLLDPAEFIAVAPAIGVDPYALLQKGGTRQRPTA